MRPPEKPERKVQEMPRVARFQFLAHLLHFRSGLGINHAQMLLLGVTCVIALSGCRPTKQEFERHDQQMLQAYNAATNAAAAQVVLLDWEKTFTKYEEAETKGISFPWHKQMLYGRLHAVYERLGDTNGMKRCERALFPNAKEGQYDLRGLLTQIEDLDRQLAEPKWRDSP
jgi:hypothetical protein